MKLRALVVLLAGLTALMTLPADLQVPSDPRPDGPACVLAMSTCTGTRSRRSAPGHRAPAHEYQSTHPADDVMGVMLMYIQPN